VTLTGKLHITNSNIDISLMVGSQRNCNTSTQKRKIIPEDNPKGK
jgi:hypothetical protein